MVGVDELKTTLVQLVEDDLLEECGHDPLDPCCVTCHAQVVAFRIGDEGVEA